LWAIGVYDFGLSSEQFWDLTPPQFAALSDRHDDRNQRDEFYSANVASIIANCHRDEKSRPKPYTPKDFMPSYAAEEEAQATPGDMSPDAILTYLKAAFPPREVKEDHG
jgi:hypothetical protein